MKHGGVVIATKRRIPLLLLFLVSCCFNIVSCSFPSSQKSSSSSGSSSSRAETKKNKNVNLNKQQQQEEETKRRKLLSKKILTNLKESIDGTASSSSSGGAVPLIVGGSTAPNGRYPYFSLVLPVDPSSGLALQICGGSIIHDDIVLSSAQCYYDLTTGIPYNDIAVIAGMITLPLDFNLIQIEFVDKTFVPTNFNPILSSSPPSISSFENDFFVMKLLNSFVVGGTVQSISLNSMNSIPTVGQLMTTMGFGITQTNNDSFPSQLVEVNVNALSTAQCQSNLPNYNENVSICANAFGKGTCLDDTGGPLIIPGTDSQSDILVGIISYTSQGCADISSSVPDGYSRVSAFYNAIVYFICTESSIPSTFPLCSGPTLPTLAPTPTPPLCIDDPASWVDSSGRNCSWYAFGIRCAFFGNTSANDQGQTANDACCACNGGKEPTPLIWSGIGACTSSNPCNNCEGGCTVDSDCGATSTSSDLRCFNRSGLESVPGCTGTGVFDGNYCINTSSIVYICVDNPLGWVDSLGDGCDWYSLGTRCEDFGNGFANQGTTANKACCACGGGIVPKNLSWFGFSGCSLSSPCNVCEGDCDVDSHCVGDLRCFERGGFEPVPGCIGSGEFGGDYCYNTSSLINATIPTPSPTFQPPTPQPISLSSSPTPAPVPSSDCLDDPPGWVDSFGDGCDWYSIGNRCKKFGTSFENNGYTANDACCICDGGRPLPPIVDLGIDYCTSNLCGLCEGDCDSDSECEGDLRCFQRGDLTPIPGCSGLGTSGLDYCYRQGPSTIVTPTSKPTSRPTRMPSIAGLPRCIDNPIGWIDLDGRGCDWYGEKKNRCKIFGSGSINEGLNANKACCICGGGTKYTFPSLAWEGWNGCSTLSPCAECEGNCNTNDDCIGTLECFQREDGTETSLIPGCSGSGVVDANYCHDPLMNQPVLNFRGWDACSPLNPCGKCEGDCDSDLDCAGSLSCHGMNSDTVPGCRGVAAEGGDYCY